MRQTVLHKAALASILALCPLTLFAAALGDLRGKTLDGAEFGLLQTAVTRPIVGVVGFSKASSAAVDAAEKGLRVDVGADTRTAVVAVYLLDKAPGFIRPLILRSLRKKVPVQEQSGKVVITENAQAWHDHFAERLKKHPDRAFLFAVSRAGLIYDEYDYPLPGAWEACLKKAGIEPWASRKSLAY